MCATEHSEIPAEPEETPGQSNLDKGERSGVINESRRSQRVALESPVDVFSGGESDVASVEHAKTLNVSAHGALLVLTTPVELGQHMRLFSPKTKIEIECLVRSVIIPYAGGGMQVRVEFVDASPDFWGLASPPADWNPAGVPVSEFQAIKLPPEAAPPVPNFTRPKLKKAAVGTPLSELVKEITQDLAKSAETGPVALKPKRSRLLRWLIPSAAVAVLLAAWIATRKSSDSGTAANTNSSLSSVSIEDAAKIPGLENLRLATEQDFDADAVSWLRGSGQQIGGRIPGLYFGAFESNAYILVGKTNERRVVLFAGGELRYNSEYPVIAIAARFPKELIEKISWADTPPEAGGDGLLIVRAADSPASAVVLFLRSNQIIAASPTDYRQIPLGQFH